MGAQGEAAFETLLAAPSADLLCTAVLLTRDHHHAEGRLQTAVVG